MGCVPAEQLTKLLASLDVTEPILLVAYTAEPATHWVVDAEAGLLAAPQEQF
jgi:hypothetical protein